MTIQRELARHRLRRADPVGKVVARRIYLHRMYADARSRRGKPLIPPDVLAAALLRAEAEHPDVVQGHCCLRYDRGSGAVSFQTSPDFDTAPEPVVGDMVTVRRDGRIYRRPQDRDPMIWHHKWMWVADDYPGFDVEESKRRSLQWLPHVRVDEKRRIGQQSYWRSIGKRWGDDYEEPPSGVPHPG